MPRLSDCRTFTDAPNVVSTARASARIFWSTGVFLSAAAIIGCANGETPLDVSAAAYTSADASAPLCLPSRRGRTLSAAGETAAVERRVYVGDTVRISRLVVAPSENLPTSTSAWQIGDSSLARVEGELVIPIAPGRTRLTASVAGRALCVGLVTLSSGITLSAIRVEAAPIVLSLDSASRVHANLHFSNGLAVPVSDAVTWTVLDPSIATIAPGARITPRQAGDARIVAALGGLADTATVHISAVPFESVPVRTSESFVESIGVNIHLSYLDRVYGSGFRSIIIPRLQELRVRHLRDGGTTLPNDDWMREIYGRWRETAESTGARFTIIMSPRRTANGPGTNYADVSHVRELANRIGVQHIDAWEGLNEHDVSGRPDFPADVRALQ